MRFVHTIDHLVSCNHSNCQTFLLHTTILVEDVDKILNQKNRLAVLHISKVQNIQ